MQRTKADFVVKTKRHSNKCWQEQCIHAKNELWWQCHPMA